jgi:hypothetical protein
MFGVQLSVENRLRLGEKYVPVLSDSNELQFAYGWPQIKVKTLDEMLEAREYQVVAINSQDGEKEYSKWFDDEQEAELMQQSVENSDDYSSSQIIKRIKGLEHDTKELPEIELSKESDSEEEE